MFPKLFPLLVLISSSVFADAPVWEENRGQFSSNVRFLTRNGSISTAITGTGIAFDGLQERISLGMERAQSERCAPSSGLMGEVNYPGLRMPISHVPVYSSITCRSVYQGVDWVLHDAGQSIEHDWRLAAGVDPSTIVIRADKETSVNLTADGDLRFQKGRLVIVWKAPRSFQTVGGEQREIQSNYKIRGRRISLAVAAYRRDLPLVIDPVIDFSYAVNGSQDDRVSQVALDGAGNIYVAGLTSSSDFSISPSAAFASAGNTSSNPQVFVRKLSPDGTRVLFSTYLGRANLYSGHPIGLRVDAAGNAYVAANTSEIAGNVANIEPGGGIALYKLAPAGDRLVYSARVITPMNYADPVALAIDNAGNVYVGGGSTRVQISKIDPTGTKVIYSYGAKVSDYFGGLAGLALGPDGSLYIAGTSASGGLVTTPGSLSPTINDQQNFHGYLIRLKPDGSGPIFSTYVNGNQIDYLNALAVDGAGAAYVGGKTYREPATGVLAGVPLGASTVGSVSGFVTKVSAQGDQAPFHALLPNVEVGALTVDASGSIYASGAVAYGAFGLPVAIGVAKISPDGGRLQYNLSFPANVTGYSDQPMMGIAVDTQGAAFLAVSAANIRLPELVPANRISPNGFVVKINPKPAQSDVWVEAVGSELKEPGVVTKLKFIVHNSGPDAAEGVRFSSEGQRPMVCSASDGAVCNAGNSGEAVLFESIPAGGGSTVTLEFGPSISLAATARVSSTSSDVNSDNNTVAAKADSGLIPVGVTAIAAGRQVVVTVAITGAVQLSPNAYYAAPNSQIQIFIPSPQMPPPSSQGSSFGLPMTFLRWADGSTENPRTFTVSPQLGSSVLMNVAFGQFLDSSPVVNAASYASNGVAPGEFVTLKGFNLGSIGNGRVEDGRVTTGIGVTTVSFDGVLAPLVYSSAGQINAIVPYSTTGKATTKVTVQTGTATVSTIVPVVQADPALFSRNASGTGQAAALNQDGSVNAPDNPANPGDVVVLYGTGEGLVDAIPPDGAITSGPGPLPKIPVSVTIGGLPARVAYAGAAPGLAAGVIQINAVIPVDVKASHHVPVSWTAGEFSSQPGVTIALNDSPPPSYTFTTATAHSSLGSIFISPTRIAADSGAAVITVIGSGFAEGMVVRWNNQQRETKFIDSNTIEVRLLGTDLEIPHLGSIAVWNPAQTAQVSPEAALLVYLPVVNRDIVSDGKRNRIYVAVAAAQEKKGSAIAIVDPEIGRIERWVSMGSEPTKLALSDDGHYLYVALGNLVRRINLDTWTTDLDFPLGQDTGFGAREVLSMVVLPGRNNSLAVSFKRTGLSPPYLGTAVFDDGQMRPGVTPGHTGPSYLTIGPDAATLYGGDEAGTLYVMRLTAAGVTIISTIPNILGADGTPVYVGGLLYSGWGAAVDVTIPRVVRTFVNAGPTLPFPDLNRVVILGSSPPPGYAGGAGQRLTVSEISTGKLLWSVPADFLRIALNHGPVVRWGRNGVALRESQVYDDAAPGVVLMRLDLAR